MYTKYHDKVKAHTNVVTVPGTFLMSWRDFLRQCQEIELMYGQYKLDGTKSKAEYRSFVQVPRAASATTDKSFNVRITLQENINLKEDWLSIDTIQGGNRMGTSKNPAV